MQTIKRAAVEAVEADLPAAPFVGTVEEESPLLVRLDQRLVLPGQRLIFLEDIEPLKEGQRIALLRFAGGQRYLVLGKLE